MKVDNVAFVGVAVKDATRGEFINIHTRVAWRELKEADHRKEFSKVYDMITK